MINDLSQPTLGLELTAKEGVLLLLAFPRPYFFPRLATSSSAYWAPPGLVPPCFEVSIFALSPSGPMPAVTALLCSVRMFSFQHALSAVCGEVSLWAALGRVPEAL